MSYQEKKTIASIFSGVVVITGYCVHAWNRFFANEIGADDLKAWGLMILAFIGIGIAVTVVTQIVFHILLSVGVAVKRRNLDDRAIGKAVEAEIAEDEMDRLIELKSMRAGYAVAGTGFLASLATLAFGLPGSVMLNILFLSFFLGALTEAALSLYYYRAGVKHG
jgi:hypothetical protein